MNQHNYAVVEFEDNALSEVPANWLFNDGTMCWWPPSKNVTGFVIKSTPPNKETWLKYPVKLETYCKTLESARRRAEDLNYNSEQELGRGLRAKKIVQHSDSESNDSSEIRVPLNELPMYPSQSSCDRVQSTMATTVTKFVELEKEPTDAHYLDLRNNVEIIDIITPEAEPDMTLNYVDLEAQLQEIKKIIDTKFKIIIGSITELNLKVDCIMTNKSVAPTMEKKFENILKIIPLNSKEELLLFEDMMKSNADIEKELILFVKKTGGSSHKDLIIRSMKRIFADTLAKDCSWLGQRNNFKICNLKTISIIKGVAASIFDICDKDFEEICAEWFRQGKQRYARDVKKMTE